jgi:predicted ferric reductase
MVISLLTTSHREHPLYCVSLCFVYLSSANCPTNSSFDSTTLWPCSVPTLSGGIFPPRRFLHACTSTSRLDYFCLCVWSRGNIIIQRNGLFHYSRARAQISHEAGAVRVRIQLQKEVVIKAGQAINLWIPSVSVWSFLQSHPFVVISWTGKPQDHLDLFIEPRRGLTRELLYHAKNVHAMNPLVLFSGPHGKSVPMDDSENILMVAGGFGIAAHLPYLKQLINGYNSRKVRARRIHLVWEVHDISGSPFPYPFQAVDQDLIKLDVIVAAQPLLNGALNEDTLDNGWVCNAIAVAFVFR